MRESERTFLDLSELFTRTGEMGALMRSTDWTQTPLGPVDQWSTSLKTMLGVLLSNRFPMALCWGPQLLSLYNDAYRPILGEKHPSALGRPFGEVWNEIWHLLGPLADSVLSGAGATWSEHLLLPMNRKGYVEETYFTFSYSPVPGDDGRVGGMLVTCQETTEQVQDDRQLRMLQDLGRRGLDAKSPEEACRRAAEVLQQNATDVPFALLYVVDEAGTGARLIASAGLDQHDGPAKAPWIDLTADDVLGWPLAQATTNEVVATLADRVGTLPGGTADVRAEHAVVRPMRRAGQPQPYGYFVAGVSPRRALDERYRRLFRLVVDQIVSAIANASAFEEERKRAEALAAIDHAKTAFFSNVSHEFRTPLTLMLGPTEDALASSTRALSGENLETVYRNELRLLKLVNALLDFSRLEAGRMRAAYEPTDLAQLTADLASSFRSAFERAGLQFAIACDPLTEPVYVDRGMWEKIVLNLLSNALKFTFEGGVEVQLTEDATGITLAIRDTGIGIADADIPHVFERFRRVEGARARTHEGSGIGMALVNDLVRLHGGSCSVTSTLGAGTTVSVRVPKGTRHLATDAIRETSSAASTAGTNPFVIEALRWLSDDPTAADILPSGLEGDLTASSTHARTIAGGHVLVVDDNADMREYLARLLRTHWTVTTAADGEAALAAIDRHTPDLVLSDVMMPGIDGFELLKTLRSSSRTSAIPVIMLSARAGEEATIEGIQAGADDYLVKPFAARELIARVKAHMAVAQGARERAELLVREQDARREAELQKQHLYSLFMQAPTAIVVLRGREYVVELANPVTCRIWGRRHEDVINRPLFEALPEIRDQVWKGLLDGVFDSGVPHIGNATPARLNRGGDGVLETVYLSFVYTPLRNVREEVDGILVIASDVTEQVTARDQMNRLREVAEAANRAKDEFLAMLGHELRNPLAPILTALQLLKLRGVAAAERERVVIERQVAHLVSLVDDLLDVSRITRGKIDLRRAPVETADVVARAIEMASPLLEQQSHALTVEVPRTGLVVDGDSGRLAQVVANLLTNAAKYTEAGGAITVRAYADGDDVVLSVRDTGLGIDAEMLPRVFDLFVQERQTLDRARGGLGLGLAIVRSIVTMHGGTVSAISAGKGEGSEFTVRLPRVNVATRSTDARLDDAPVPTPVANGVRVLVVDDNHDGAVLLAEMLSALGYVTRFAQDGPSAIRAAEEFDPDIALLDIGLPIMDGYELAERFAAHPRLSRTALFAVTGYGQQQDRRRSEDAGFLAHLVKPVDIDQLRMALESLTRSRP